MGTTENLKNTASREGDQWFRHQNGLFLNPDHLQECTVFFIYYFRITSDMSRCDKALKADMGSRRPGLEWKDMEEVDLGKIWT